MFTACPLSRRSRCVIAVIALLVALMVTAPVALPAVSAQGLPFIPVITASEIPADAHTDTATSPPAPRPDVLPSPVAVAGQPAPTPVPVAVAAPPTPAPTVVADQPVPSPTAVVVANEPVQPPIPAAETALPIPITVEDLPAPLPVAVGVPKRIRIATAGIDANVELVGLERDGSVGTPKNYDNTGWYEPGPRPGEPGNAVMLGHVDSAALKRGAVFWNLRLVKPGDDITVVSDDGIAHHFTVTGQQQYNPQNVPIAQIFGQADGVHLNLITCDATTPFNRRTGEYAGWLLVTADATP